MLDILEGLKVYHQRIKQLSKADEILCGIYIGDNKFSVYNLDKMENRVIEIGDEVSLTKATLENMTSTVCKDVDNSLFYNSKIDNPFDLNVYDIAVIPLEDMNMSCSWGFITLYNLKDGKNNGFKKECLNAIRALNSEIYNSVIESKLITKIKQPYCGREILEQKLERAMQFFSSVVHDMRTPINAVMGFLELLEQRVSPKDKEYVIAGYRSAEMVSALINDVLDFSKIEAGKMELDIHYFSPIDELKNIAYLFYKIAYDKGVDFCIYFDVNMPFAIRSDPYRFKQILNNFLSNAIKFTPAKKKVKMEVIYNRDSDSLRIDVKDEGIGMTKEEMSHLFKPFHQANNQISGKFGGTGLGLVVSKQLADMLGAKIEVESQKGKGSTFSLILPCNTIPGTPKAIEIKDKKLPKVYLVKVKDEYLEHIYLISKYFDELGLDYEFVSIEETLKQKESYKKGFLIFDEESYHDSIFIDILNSYKNRVLFIVSDIIFEVSKLPETNILHRPIFPDSLIDKILNILSSSKSFKSDIKKKNFKNLNVIIADDNKINLKLLQEILKNLKVTPYPATNAKEVLDIIRNTADDIDMIFIDEIMPDMKGSEAIKEIRKIDKYKDIPIYSLTGISDKDTINIIKSAGATDILFKPLKNRTIEELINKYR